MSAATAAIPFPDTAIPRRPCYSQVSVNRQGNAKHLVPPPLQRCQNCARFLLDGEPCGTEREWSGIPAYWHQSACSDWQKTARAGE